MHEKQPSRMNALIETLFSYRALSMDWDGYGGLPVNLRSPELREKPLTLVIGRDSAR